MRETFFQVYVRQTENNKITDRIADINFAGMTEVLNP